jgi:hypothetical protein
MTSYPPGHQEELIAQLMFKGQEVTRERDEARAEAERLREEYRRIAWCHSGPGGVSCPACHDRAKTVLGDDIPTPSSRSQT